MPLLTLAVAIPLVAAAVLAVLPSRLGVPPKAVALGAAVLTAIAWTAVGSPDEAVVRVITVLVIACPHALGLAIPLVVSISTERAARGGVLPVWADPMALADETEADRLRERRLYAGLAAAIAVVVLLWTVRALVM